MKLKPDSGSELKSFFVRLVVVEHLHHHLNFSVDVKSRQRYYSALVKQNKNPVQIQGLCSDNQ